MAISRDIDRTVDPSERDEALRRLSLLAETGSLLGVSLDPETVLERVSELLVPAFADWCAIDLLQPDGSIARVASRSADLDQTELSRQLPDHPPKPVGTHPVLEVLATGKSMLLTEMPDEVIARIADGPEHRAMIEALGPRSAMMIPLVARGKTHGAMQLATTASDRVFTVEDLHLIEDVAARVALAVDNARLFTEIQQTEERYRALVQSLDAVVYEWAPDAEGYRFVSEHVATMLEYPVERWYRDPYLLEHLLHPEDRDRILAARNAPTNGSLELDYRVVRADGRTVWVHDSVRIEYDDAGEPCVFRGVITDVTRRKIEAQYEHAQEAVVRVFAHNDSMASVPIDLLRAICETLGWDTGVLWRVDEPSRTLRAVDVWAAPDLDVSSFSALTMRMAFPPGVGLPGRTWERHQPMWVENIAEEVNFPRAGTAALVGLRSAMSFPVLAAGRILGVMEFYSRGSRAIDEDLLSLMSSVGAQVGQFIERRQTEEALNEEQARARAVLESSLDAVLSMDAQGNLIEFNPAAERLFGHRREDVLGSSLGEVIVPPALREAHRRGVARYLATRDSRVLNKRLELSAIRADGTEFPVELTVVRVEASGPPMFTGFIRDITARVRASRYAQVQSATTSVLAEVQTLDEAAPRILADIATTLGWQAGVLWLVQPDGLRARDVWADETPECQDLADAIRTATFSPGTDAAGRAWETGQPVWLRSDDETAATCPLAQAQKLGRTAIPIRADDRVIGVLGFYHLDTATPDAELRSILIGIGSQLGQYMERRRVESDIRFQKTLLESQSEATIDGIVITSTAGEIISFNRRFVELWNIPPDVAADLSKLAAHCVAQYRDPEPFVQRAKYLHSHPDISDREEIELKDGRMLDRFTAALRSDAGDHYGRAWYYRDITETKRFNTALSESSRRFAFLAEASTILVGSLDQSLTLTNLARLVVPYLADWCVIDVLQDDGSVRRIAVDHTDPGGTQTQESDASFDLDPLAERGVSNVLRTGEPEFEPEVSPAWLATASGGDPDFRASIDRLGLRSYMCLPLQARGRMLGAVTLAMSDSGRLYTRDDLALAEDLARRASLAVDNARLYAEQQYVARTLQERLLPQELPDIPGAEVRARYHAAGEAIRVGGDLYDVFPYGDIFGLVIGDVCGKGPEAAALTALARYTIRAAALQNPDPENVLRQLNDAIRNQTINERFCTVAMSTYDPATRIARLVSGGHPPILVLRADGSVESAGAPGTLLGLFETVSLQTVEISLERGDALIFYTDGLTEARRPDGGVLGEDNVRQLVADCAGMDASSIAAHLERAAIDLQLGTPRDDIAVLVLKVFA